MHAVNLGKARKIVASLVHENDYNVFRRSIPQNFEEYVVTAPR